VTVRAAASVTDPMTTMNDGSKTVTKMQKQVLSSARRSTGLTMVEILIAVLIISVGLLGVAALHSLSLRNNYTALLRSHASALAGDIADRMRANRTVALNSEDYLIALGATASEDEDEESTVSAVAINDLIEWKQSLLAQLPNGDGSIEIDAATRMVTITIQWGERPQATDGVVVNDADDRLVQFVTQTEI
jgi:type IV pilus assembly protein PilV